MVVGQATAGRPHSRRKSLLEAVRRKKEIMAVMKGMKKKPASRNFRRALTPYALMEVRLCTLPITNSSD